MKTTMELPDELVRRMKIRAVQEGRPLKRLVADLLNRALSHPGTLGSGVVVPPPPPGPIELNERGFPVIRCGPNAPASRMTAEELIAQEQKALQEEDMRRARQPA
jgi:hypothetical protein